MASGEIIEVAVVEEAISAEIVEQAFDISVQEESYEVDISPENITIGLDYENIDVVVEEEVIEVQVESWCNPCFSDDAADIATKTTILNITASKPSSSNFFVDSGGTDYIKLRDDGSLSASASAFINNEKIQIFLNGSNLKKDIHVTWTSPVSFSLNFAVDAGDFIKVIS